MRGKLIEQTAVGIVFCLYTIHKEGSACEQHEVVDVPMYGTYKFSFCR